MDECPLTHLHFVWGSEKKGSFCDMNWQSSSFQVCFVHLEFHESDSTMDIRIDENGRDGFASTSPR